MCGIVGVLGQVARGGAALVDPMLDVIEHRGPDDRGTCIDAGSGVGLGAVRLAVIDVSPAGHQPMTNGDRSVSVALNGEIYNHGVLREELAATGSRFAGRSDTEVVLRAWEAWGPAAVDRFDGMFGLAVWDRRAPGPSLRLYRDRAGEKPLYWWHDGASFAFASEAKALFVIPGVRAEVEPEALATYLAVGFVPSPLTMFRGVRKLEPGESLTIAPEGTPTTERYWRVGPMAYGPSAQVAPEQVRERVTASITDRLVSDVPHGVFLSGGVDSTIVAGVASATLSEPVKTFTAAFDVGPRSFKYNVDADAAEAVAARFGTSHTRFTIRPQDDFMGAFTGMVDHLDEPHANPTCLTTFLLAREIRRAGITVMLTGDGSDEIFGGYGRYGAERSVSRLRRLPAPMRNAAREASKLAGVRGEALARGLTKAEVPPATTDAVLSWWIEMDQESRGSVLVPGVANVPLGTLSARTAAALADLQPTTGEDAVSAFDREVWLADESNMRVDKLTMAHSIEARAAFEGHRLVELMAPIPLAAKAGRGRFRSKALLKEAFVDLLPSEVAQRPKWGWLSPIHYWVNDFAWDELAGLVRTLPSTGLFAPAVTDVVGARPSMQPRTVWALAVFARWHQRFIEGSS